MRGRKHQQTSERSQLRHVVCSGCAPIHPRLWVDVHRLQRFENTKARGVCIPLDNRDCSLSALEKMNFTLISGVLLTTRLCK